MGTRELTLRFTDGEWDRLNKRALKAGGRNGSYSLAGFVEELLRCDMALPEEMVYVVFDGVPTVFDGTERFLTAEKAALASVEETREPVTLMAVPRVALEVSRTAVYRGAAFVATREMNADGSAK